MSRVIHPFTALGLAMLLTCVGCSKDEGPTGVTTPSGSLSFNSGAGNFSATGPYDANATSGSGVGWEDQRTIAAYSIVSPTRGSIAGLMFMNAPAAGTYNFPTQAVLFWALDINPNDSAQVFSKLCISRTGSVIVTSASGGGAAGTFSGTGSYANASGTVSLTLLATHPSHDQTRAVHVVGNYAYIAENNAGLRVVNISNPSAPVEVGSYDNPNKQEGSYNIFVSGNYAYVANEASDISLQVFDITNPAAPALIAEFQPPAPFESTLDVEVVGNYAYLAQSTAGLRIIDVSNPASPSAVGRYDTPHQARNVCVDFGYAYVGDSEAGVQIIDVHNPSGPARIGFYDQSQEYAQDIVVDFNYAYVAYSGLGLVVLDVTNPSAPSFVKQLQIPTGYATDVFHLGDYVYVAAGGGGLRLVDVSDPLAPVERTYYDSPGFGRGVFASGDLAFLADDGGGLHILRLTTSAGTFAISDGAFNVPGGRSKIGSTTPPEVARMQKMVIEKVQTFEEK